MNKKRALHSAIITKHAKVKRQRSSSNQASSSSADHSNIEEEGREENMSGDTHPSRNDSEGESEGEEGDLSVGNQPRKKKIIKTRQKGSGVTSAPNFVDEEFFLSNFQSANSYSEKG